jgi:hypothetical protein
VAVIRVLDRLLGQYGFDDHKNPIPHYVAYRLTTSPLWADFEWLFTPLHRLLKTTSLMALHKQGMTVPLPIISEKEKHAVESKVKMVSGDLLKLQSDFKKDDALNGLLSGHMPGHMSGHGHSAHVYSTPSAHGSSVSVRHPPLPSNNTASPRRLPGPPPLAHPGPMRSPANAANLMALASGNGSMTTQPVLHLQQPQAMRSLAPLMSQGLVPSPATALHIFAGQTAGTMLSEASGPMVTPAVVTPAVVTPAVVTPAVVTPAGVTPVVVTPAAPSQPLVVPEAGGAAVAAAAAAAPMTTNPPPAGTISPSQVGAGAKRKANVLEPVHLFEQTVQTLLKPIGKIPDAAAAAVVNAGEAAAALELVTEQALKRQKVSNDAAPTAHAAANTTA